MTTHHIRVVFVLTAILGGAVYGYSFLDAEELEKLHYAIQIDGKPVKIGDASRDSPGRVVPIVNKFGQTYHCTLPLPEGRNKVVEAALPEDGEGEAATEPGEQEPPVGTKERIQRLLDPLKKGNCLLRTKDWWTYELCVGRAIKQYHLEDGKPIGVTQILGHYDSDYEWNDGDKAMDQSLPSTNVAAAAAAAAGQRKYHSQFYKNGSECDLTGHFRASEVRFECDPSAGHDVIVSIEEPLSCEYVLTVATSRICDVEQLRPTPTEKPREIKCSPALTEAEYDKFLKYEKAQEELTRLRKLEQKKQQKKRMLKVLSEDELKGIDVDSEEGFADMEQILNEKLAEKLVAELEGILNPKSLSEMELSTDGGVGTFAFKRVFADDLLTSVGSTGISKKPTFLDLVNHYIWERKVQAIGKKKRIYDDVQRVDEPGRGKLDELRAEREEGEEVAPHRVGKHKMPDNERPDAEGKGLFNSDDDIIRRTKEYMKAEDPDAHVNVNSDKFKAVKEHFRQHFMQHDIATGSNIMQDDENEANLEGERGITAHEEHEAGEEHFDVDTERKVRSDLVTEEEMLEELSDAVTKLPEATREEAIAFAKSKNFQAELQEALEEIVEETEIETGTRLDRANADGEDVLTEWSDTIKDLIAKVDKADKQIQQVNMEIEEVKKRAAELGDPIDEDADDEDFMRKGSGKEQDAGLFRDETQKGDDVKIKVTDLTQMTAIKNSPTEKKVAQRLESVIKQKLSKAGLDTGGRQIEVKLVTTTSIGGLDGLGGDGNDDGTDRGLSAFTGGEEKDMSNEEQQQFQNMVYNLMIGNTAAYEDIDGQRRSERNYKFAWDDELIDKTSEVEWFRLNHSLDPFEQVRFK